MPVGFNSPARNLFLLGSSGAQVVTNFFKTIDQSAGTDGFYLPSEIKYNFVDQKFLLAGSAEDSNSKGFGWFEKRDETGTADFENRIEATTSVNTTLLAMELDVNDKLIVGGKTGDVPWIAKYSNSGVIEWQSTTNSADVEYTGITSDSNGQYYACGSQYPGSGAVAFVEKFDANGNPGWGKAGFMLGREVLLNAIAANSRGEVVAVGQIEDDNSYKGYIVKIDTNTGEVLWDRTLTQHLTAYGYVACQDVYIDSKDQIYIVGVRSGGNPSEPTEGFLIKYSPEGNIIWQKASYTPNGTLTNHAVKSDGETEQTIVFGTYYDQINNDLGGVLSKYSKNGDLVWRRAIFSSYNNSDVFGSLALDADPSFYYLLYVDDNYNGLTGTPEAYTFGKVSSSGNGLGNFQYAEGTGETIDYEILNVQDKIGRLSDGSVRQDTSDLITYPFNGTKILFDDLATQVANKKRQMDSAGSFEYSGSPAIRPVDFPSLYLDAKNDVRNGTVVDPDSGIVGTYNTFGPFPGSNSVYLGGSNADPNTYGWQGYVDIETAQTGSNSGAPDLNIGTNLWTMEAWFYITAYPASSRAMLMSLRHNQYTSNPDTLSINSSGLLEYSYQEGLFVNNSNTIPLNTWVHIAMAKNPTDDTKTLVLLNGTCVFTASNGRTTGHSSNGYFKSRLGWTQYQFTTGYQYLKGYISNYRFSLDNVYGISNSGNTYTVPTSTLGLLPSTMILALHEGLANYSFNKSNFAYGMLDQTTCRGPWAATTNDIFAVSDRKFAWVKVLDHNWTTQVRGAKIYGLTDRVNREKGYWEFNGDDDYIDFTNPNIGQEFTLEAWVKPTNFPANGSEDNGIFGTDSESPRCQFDFNEGSTPGTNTKLRFFDSSLTPADVSSADISVSSLVNTWSHVIVTRSGTTTTLYMNGSVLTSGTQTGTTNTNLITKIGTSARLVGGSTGPQYFEGYIGEARIYPRALTAAQVFQNYNATKSKYINKAPDTAPKIGPGIVYDNNLLLNYDFGNRATFDTRNTSFTKITPPTAGNGANFGYHTRQLTNGFVTGEPWNNDGVVYWYDKNGNNVATVADPTASGSWGYYLFSDSANRVLVNAPYYNNGTTNGFLYVYDGSGTLLHTIPRPEYNPGVNHPTWSNIEEICAIGEGKIAVMDSRFYDPGTSNRRSAFWIMDEDGTNQIRVLNPDLTKYSDFNYNIFIDNGYVYVYTSAVGGGGDVWTVWNFTGNFIGEYSGYPIGVGEGRFITNVENTAYIYDSTNNFNLVGTFDTSDYSPYGGDYGTQSFHVRNGHIYVGYDGFGLVRSYDLNGNFEKDITGPNYLNETRLSNAPIDNFGYNNLVDFGDGSYAIAAPYDSGYDGAIYLLKPTTVKNLSSSSYTGTINGATFNSAGYFDFDGTNDGISVSSLPTNFTNITVEWWGTSNYPDANYRVPVMKTTSTSWSDGFGFYQQNGVISWWVNQWNGTGATETQSSTTSFGFTYWVGTYDGSNVKLYRNGVLENTAPYTNAMTNPNVSFDIGNSKANYYWDGNMGQVRIYNRALTATEVSQNFNATRSKYGV